MINKDKIFKLFLDGKEINDPKTEEKLKDFMNGPFAQIGMFVKLIQNHYVFHKKLEKFLKAENPSYDVDDARKASEYTVFNRAFFYIKNITPKHSKVIKSFNKKQLNSALQATMDYFESTEEYEKCAHLLKIQKAI